MSVGGIVFLTWTALTYEGNDLAQVGILIGLLGSVSTGILGFMSGLVLGRHISESEQRGGPEATSSSPG